MEVSINKLNIVNEKNVGRCVDMIILGILDGLCVHGIDGANNIPSWNTQCLKDWWDPLFDFFELLLSNDGCVVIWCNVKLPWLQGKIVSFSHGNKGCELEFRLINLFKIYIMVNYLLQLGFIPSYVTTLSNILVFRKPKHTFDFFDMASYIEPSMDVKYMDVIFNNIIVDTMSLKPFGELWKGGKEKNLLIM
jgi:hypothetical protein